MFSRKNDGTVKMTRQRATSKTGLLGMTGGKGTLFGYLQVGGEKTPREEAGERLKQLATAAKAGKCVTYQQDGDVTFKLCYRGFIYWWVKKEAYDTSKSIRYPNRSNALLAFKRNRIRWVEFVAAGEEVDEFVPWTYPKPQ
jgi:hypothetical protein